MHDKSGHCIENDLYFDENTQRKDCEDRGLLNCALFNIHGHVILFFNIFKLFDI